ncbi:MAG: hypothetical protein E7317_02645 [Clostridiales bacterium]|nr:hypothetical protein [Clostridiales bacterium]
MHQFIFGFDAADPRGCAKKLRARGIDGVVLGSASPDVEEALAAEGIELSLFFQAYALPHDAGEDMLARDIDGAPRAWFSSGCPNDRDNAQRNLDAALKRMRATPTARRLIVDGARFASFASPEGTDAFYTCFCPKCISAMRGYGRNPDRLIAAARALKQGGYRHELDDLWTFRQEIVEDYFQEFAEAVHGLPGHIEAGAFVFAPSLSGFVGQSMDAQCALDWVSPMLYRAWPEAEGPACLNHELAGAFGIFGREGLETACAIEDMLFEPDARTPDEIRAQGYPPERIGREVAWARQYLEDIGDLLTVSEGLFESDDGDDARIPTLAPILQLKDPLRDHVAKLALENGADQIGWFAYGHDD